MIVIQDLIQRITSLKGREVTKMKDKTYTIFWLTGKSQIVTGREPHEAMNNAGIGAGAIRAMDFYGEGDLRDKWEWNSDARTWTKIREQ